MTETSGLDSVHYTNTTANGHALYVVTDGRTWPSAVRCTGCPGMEWVPGRSGSWVVRDV